MLTTFVIVKLTIKVHTVQKNNLPGNLIFLFNAPMKWSMQPERSH
jgi:hypothetical protein